MIQTNDRNKIIYVNQLNVYILPCLFNSRRGMEISSRTHMDLCSTKHTCSNSACQMFADKWLYSRTQKKKKKIISDKQRYRQMTDHSRGGTTGVESHAGLVGLLSATGSLLSCEALRVQCLSIRCGDPMGSSLILISY